MVGTRRDGATAWRRALSSAERRTVIEMLRAYEDALGRLDPRACRPTTEGYSVVEPILPDRLR